MNFQYLNTTQCNQYRKVNSMRQINGGDWKYWIPDFHKLLFKNWHIFPNINSIIWKWIQVGGVLPMFPCCCYFYMPVCSYIVSSFSVNLVYVFIIDRTEASHHRSIVDHTEASHHRSISSQKLTFCSSMYINLAK